MVSQSGLGRADLNGSYKSRTSSAPQYLTVALTAPDVGSQERQVRQKAFRGGLHTYSGAVPTFPRSHAGLSLVHSKHI